LVAAGNLARGGCWYFLAGDDSSSQSLGFGTLVNRVPPNFRDEILQA
jgi:hypothetical protein